MQPKIVFLENLIAHREFSIVSEVFLCLSYFFFMCDYLTSVRGHVSTLVYLCGGFCPFMPFFIGGQMSRRAYVLHSEWIQPDTKRKRKRQEKWCMQDKHKSEREAYNTSSLFPKRGDHNAKQDNEDSSTIYLGIQFLLTFMVLFL